MAKRKKHPRLPSGMGSVAYIGPGRRNAYVVREPSSYDENGKTIKGKVICYTDSWIHGFSALLSYRAGTYQPGSEIEFDTTASSNLAERIIADYLRISKRTDGLSFSEVYKQAYEWKFSHEERADKTKAGYEHGYSYCKAIYDKPLVSITHQDLQTLVDDCPKSYQTKLNIKKTISLVYKYALVNKIVSDDLSKNILLKSEKSKHGQPFTDEELRKLWKDSDSDDWAKRILIMCLSGYRLSAYKDLKINLEEKYFKGGVKTDAGKNRIVPIHEAIYPFVVDILERYGTLGIKRADHPLEIALRRVNPNATAHWTRHTFSVLCERFNVRENDRKRMLGHKVGDVTNDVYGHRTLEDLRAEISKIDVQKIVQQEV